MRITAGTAGSRKIETPAGLATRPTHDKVKEALFSMIGPFFDGGAALDLFAGSGALGLEAISRGMARCVFVDRAREAARVVRRNAGTLGFADKSEIFLSDYGAALEKLSARGDAFDLIFLDPPYDAGLLAPALEAIARLSLLKRGGRVYCEMRAGTSFEPPAGYAEEKRRRYGEALIAILTAGEEDAQHAALSGEL